MVVQPRDSGAFPLSGVTGYVQPQRTTQRTPPARQSLDGGPGEATRAWRRQARWGWSGAGGGVLQGGVGGRTGRRPEGDASLVGCGVRGAGVGGSSLDGRRVETEAWLGSSWSLGGVKGLTAARRQKRRERPGSTRVRWSGKGRLRLSLGGAGVPLPPGGWGPVGVQTWPRCATPLSLQLKNMPRCWSRVKTAVCKATHPEHVLTTASP